MSRLPLRSSQAQVNRAGDDTLVYDVGSDEVFLLTAEAAAVLELCDGRRTEAEAMALTGLSSDELRSVLDQLADLDLLEGVTRRSALARTAVIGGGVLLASVVGPAAMAHASGTGGGTGGGTGTTASTESFNTALPNDLTYTGGVSWANAGKPSGSLLSNGVDGWVFNGSRFVMGSVFTLDLDFMFNNAGGTRDIFNVGLWMPGQQNITSGGVRCYRIQTNYPDGGFNGASGHPADMPPVLEGVWYHLTIASDGSNVTATVKDGATTVQTQTVTLLSLAGTNTPSGYVGQVSDGAASAEGHLVDNIVLS